MMLLSILTPILIMRTMQFMIWSMIQSMKCVFINESLSKLIMNSIKSMMNVSFFKSIYCMLLLHLFNNEVDMHYFFCLFMLCSCPFYKNICLFFVGLFLIFFS